MTEKNPAFLSDIAQFLVGESEAIANVRELIRYAAKSTIPVMITGPSGSGKEVVARALHRFSERRDESFVAVNCGAIPRDLLESELFGHEKGSFTGAIAQRVGRFEDAHRGTLFLDEIGDMPFDMQVKLLRVLEEKIIERIGGGKPIAVDTRIVSATHRNLDQSITDGKFREDLYYRLSVFPIDIPPLGERKDDIMPLIGHFLRKMDVDTDTVSFSPPALDALHSYAWPGNARELRNVVERAVLLFPNIEISESQLHSLFRRRASTAPTTENAALPSSYPGQHIGLVDPDGQAQFLPRAELPEGEFDLKQYLMDEERKYMMAALERARGVVAEAASLVRIRRTTFVEKMKRHGIERRMIAVDRRRAEAERR